APAPAASPAPAATPAPAANPTPEIIATGDAAAIERARADSAAHPWTEADAHFMTAMIGHHAQAIVISRLAPTRAASNSIRTRAARVINAQQDGIALMQQWLRDRQQPVPDPGDTTAAMDHAGHQMSGHTMGAAHEMMPGMLSPAEIERLEQAEGVEFDRIFLSSMLKHHRGAVTMVEELFSSYGA